MTGAGGKSFVAGADIEEVSDFGAIEGRAWGMRGQAVLRRIESLPKPVIAAINGYALGGGHGSCQFSSDLTSQDMGWSSWQPRQAFGLSVGPNRSVMAASGISSMR